MRKIIFFHGADCPHCMRMMPIVIKLEKKLGLEVEKLEVWYNEENAEKMRKYADIIMEASDGDLGVPTFLDLKNKEAVSGEMSEADLKKWLMEK